MGGLLQLQLHLVLHIDIHKIDKMFWDFFCKWLSCTIFLQDVFNLFDVVPGYIACLGEQIELIDMFTHW